MTNGWTRRDVLARSSSGFGLLALASLLAERGHLARAADNDLAPRPTHFAPKAKRVVLLFMDGGVSHLDSFDPKPRLQRDNGKPFPIRIEATQFDQNGQVLASPFTFARHGQSGIPVSDLFPHIAGCVDDLCVVRSMRAPFAEHTQAVHMMHLGHPLRGRPTLGSWVSYGLGSECANLPSYVVLDGGQLPLGGIANYASGFLPATHEGTLFNVSGTGNLVTNIRSPLLPAAAGDETTRELARQQSRLRFITRNDQNFARTLGNQGAVESAIRNYELAFAMQQSVPQVSDLAGESRATLDLYGVNAADNFRARYARQCLLARRLLERGVRFVEITCVGGLRNVAPWDSHDNIRGEHKRNAEVVDQPIAGLLKDLKARGMLDDTLVIWTGEFGRTPFAQGSTGRDHNPHGFTIWMAGGGVRPGMIHGATDEFGYHAIENVVTVHDLHATILHLLGLDHTRLTFRYAGRDFRLTDVHGEVVRNILI